MLKDGNRVINIETGFEGTIDCDLGGLYLISWDNGCNYHTLCFADELKLIKEKKIIKKFGIVEFCEKYYK